MKLISLDIEMNQPSGSIIEIGAAIGESDTCEVLDYKGWLVYLPQHEVLSQEIINLTRITTEELRTKGMGIDDAFRELVKYHAESGAHMNPVTWSDGDVTKLRRAVMEYMPAGVMIPDGFGRRTFDAKTLYSSWRLANGKPTAGGLSRAMTKFGLKFTGRKHRAPDDAANTLEIYFELLKRFRTPDHSELIARLRHWNVAEDEDTVAMLNDIEAAANALEGNVKALA